MTTQAIDGMKYEQAGSKVSKNAGRQEYQKLITNHSSLLTIWFLAVKHKLGILAMTVAVLLIDKVYPQWPELVQALMSYVF